MRFCCMCTDACATRASGGLSEAYLRDLQMLLASTRLAIGTAIVMIKGKQDSEQ